MRRGCVAEAFEKCQRERFKISTAPDITVHGLPTAFCTIRVWDFNDTRRCKLRDSPRISSDKASPVCPASDTRLGSRRNCAGKSGCRPEHRLGLPVRLGKSSRGGGRGTQCAEETALVFFYHAAGLVNAKSGGSGPRFPFEVLGRRPDRRFRSSGSRSSPWNDRG